MEILAFNYFFLGRGGGYFFGSLKKWQFAWMSMDISTRKQNVLCRRLQYDSITYEQTISWSHIEK